jgi:hypothetical protein
MVFKMKEPLMRRTHLLNVLVAILLVVGLLVPSAVTALSSTTVVKLWVGNNIMSIGGVRQPIDSEGTKPVIVEGRTLVPIRAVIEAFDGSVAWDATERKVTVTLGENVLDLWIGKSAASLNGTSLPVDAANPRIIPVIMSGRTMLPLRFVAESLGIDVQYEATTKMITLTYVVNTTPPAPSPPLLLSPTDGSKFMNELPKLSWLLATGTDASRLQILSSGVEVYTKSNLTGSDYIVPAGVLADGTYTWRVSVHNEGGWGPWSVPRSFTLSSPIVPLAPSLVSPTNHATVTAEPVTLAWTAVSSASAYRVRVLFGTAQVHAATDIAGTSYVVPSGVLGAGTYSWQVGTYAGDTWSDWSEPWVFTLQPMPPSVPTSLSVSSSWNANSPGFPSITISWNAVPEATGYETWVRSAGGTSVKLGTSDAAHTTFNSNGQPGGNAYVPGVTYYFKACALSSAGTSAFTSEVSCTAAGPPTLMAPILSSPANAAIVTTKTAALAWNYVSGASAYEVQWGTSTDFVGATRVMTASMTTYEVGGGATYYWRVRAVGSTSGTFSPWSSTWSFASPNPLVVQGDCIFHQGGMVGNYISGAILNASEYVVSSATIAFAGLDGNGKTVARLTYVFHNIGGGQVVAFTIGTASDVVHVVFLSLTIP